MDIRRRSLRCHSTPSPIWEIPEEDGNRLELDRIKLMALDTLIKSYICEFGHPDESNITEKEICQGCFIRVFYRTQNSCLLNLFLQVAILYLEEFI